jgi:hypothetical protein
MMSIGFDSDEIILEKLRERLHRMTDNELIEFGKMSANLPRIPFSDNWMRRERSGSEGNYIKGNRAAMCCTSPR